MNLRDDARSFALALGVVLLGGTAWLATRSVGTIDRVLSVREVTTAPAKVESGRFDAVATRMHERRQRVVAAEVAGRDPFVLPAVPAKATAPAAAPAPKADPVPRLQALVYDNVRPQVRLLVGTAGSDWLVVGQGFKGWTVLDIRPGSVRIGNGTRQYELGMN
ncbi:MAG TPA: hypothetical protein PLQ13_09775 [Candidatus Krumholzibacteria bacterium]|nr:hypothetical protein [Candidatus Krumholzibacteria bacterium]